MAETVSVDSELNESYKQLSCSIYKIGDFGHVTKNRSSRDGPAASDTGDARYLSLERFTETWENLEKSDIFRYI